MARASARTSFAATNSPPPRARRSPECRRRAWRGSAAPRGGFKEHIGQRFGVRGHHSMRPWRTLRAPGGAGEAHHIATPSRSASRFELGVKRPFADDGGAHRPPGGLQDRQRPIRRSNALIGRNSPRQTRSVASAAASIGANSGSPTPLCTTRTMARAAISARNRPAHRRFRTGTDRCAI